MNIRMVFFCGALLLFSTITSGAGSYQRTRDGQTLVWRDVPERGNEATWSGKRDKNGFATGRGVLTWYKVEPSTATGSHIRDTRRYIILINHYSGRMVRGKFRGAVTDAKANGKRSQAAAVNQTNRSSRRHKLTRTPAPGVRSTPTVESSSTPLSERIIVEAPERTSGLATPTPGPEQSSSRNAEESQAPEQNRLPIAQQSQTAARPETATLVAKQMTTPPSQQQATHLDARTISASTSSNSDDSLRLRSAAPFELPRPPRTIDTETVAKLDAVYQSAVKANDTAIMEEILADDFVLVTDDGASLTKADLIKEAQEKRTLYQHQEVEEGTQKVRIWRDTAVVTALLRITGTRDQNAFYYKTWVSETYVRTPTGWRYVFRQPLKQDPK